MLRSCQFATIIFTCILKASSLIIFFWDGTSSHFHLQDTPLVSNIIIGKVASYHLILLSYTNYVQYIISDYDVCFCQFSTSPASGVHQMTVLEMAYTLRSMTKTLNQVLCTEGLNFGICRTWWRRGWQLPAKLHGSTIPPRHTAYTQWERS